MQNNSKFAELKFCNNIWAIGSIHSHLDSFELIKNHIIKNFSKNDKIVFLGNIIGLGHNAKETLSSAIDLRNQLMSNFFLKTEDVVFLRGAQEEMFLKLLQLQTAPNPYEIVKWLFEHGVDKTIHSYNLNVAEVHEIATQGTIAISRWTSKLNKTIASVKGHKEYFSNLHHAAFADTKKILFVNRGVDITRPLSAQNDCFWWGYHNFSKLDKPYDTFKKIVRGYEPSSNKNLDDIKKNVVCSLYQGPLSNNKIVAGLFNDSAEILDLFVSQ